VHILERVCRCLVLDVGEEDVVALVTAIQCPPYCQMFSSTPRRRGRQIFTHNSQGSRPRNWYEHLRTSPTPL